MLKSKLPLFISFCRSECSFSEHTCNAYQRDLTQFFAITHTVTYSSIQTYVHWLYSKEFLPKTKARKLASFRSFLQFCIREGFCESELLLAIPQLRVPQRLPRSLDQSVINALLCLPDITTPKGFRDRVILELLYSTGIRVSECVKIKLSDIDLMEGVILISGKGNKERHIPLTTLCKQYLNQYLVLVKDNFWLFQLPSTQKPLSRFTIYSIIKKYSLQLSHLNLAEQSITPHSFRHAFATHLLEGGARLRDVQVLLGHQQLSSSQIYSHINTKTVKQTYLRSHPRGSL